jgi:hypothetical protein
VIIIGLSVSFITGKQDPNTLDPKLLSPVLFKIVRRFPKCLKSAIGWPESYDNQDIIEKDFTIDNGGGLTRSSSTDSGLIMKN